MKIEGVGIYDKEKKVYFSFIKQFPGICAQADSIEEAQRKMDVYFNAFIQKMKDQKVEMGVIETFD